VDFSGAVNFSARGALVCAKALEQAAATSNAEAQGMEWLFMGFKALR
jgi:hypothetical protein